MRIEYGFSKFNAGLTRFCFINFVRKNTMESVNLKLNERIKELSCLYALSKVTSDANMDFNEKINAFLTIIPKGFQHINHLKVGLTLAYQDINILPKEQLSRILKGTIQLQNKTVGTIFVGYSNTFFDFLDEEKKLLEHICKEIQVLLELEQAAHHQKLLQNKITSDDKLNLMGELTAGIAHELNTPLGHIIGFAELLKKKVKDPLNRKDLEKIIQSGIHAREIVKKLMFFSCEMPFKFKTLDISHIIQGAIDLTALQLQDKKLKIILQKENEDTFIHGDELQLNQVILNLILNAMYASPIGRNIYVDIRKVESQVIVDIKDEGEGVSEENTTKIFEPFFTTKKGGTGLGLAVVHGIMQLMQCLVLWTTMRWLWIISHLPKRIHGVLLI